MALLDFELSDLSDNYKNVLCSVTSQITTKMYYVLLTYIQCLTHLVIWINVKHEYAQYSKRMFVQNTYVCFRYYFLGYQKHIHTLSFEQHYLAVWKHLTDKQIGEKDFTQPGNYLIFF